VYPKGIKVHRKPETCVKKHDIWVEMKGQQFKIAEPVAAAMF
jgi:hypothetical protein